VIWSKHSNTFPKLCILFLFSPIKLTATSDHEISPTNTTNIIQIWRRHGPNDPARASQYHNLSQRPFPILSQKRNWGSTLALTRLNWQAQVVEVGKHAIMHRTGLHARDLRILDPLLSYLSTVLGRERAIVINLEHVKAIITAHVVLLLNSRDPSVTPFVEELQGRLMFHYHAIKAQVLLILFFFFF